MSNTIIKIQRSDVTLVPPDGSLEAGEQAYSFLSNKLFVGNTSGLGVIEIGGKYWVDTTIAAYNHANAAFAAANTGATVSAAFDQANAAFVHANSSFVQANTARDTANNALPQSGGTIAGDLVVTGNATFSGQTTYANTTHLDIGDNILTLNADLPPAVAPSENAGIEINRGSSPNVALIWDEGADKWEFTTDGTIYYVLPTNTAVEQAQTDAVGAFVQANTARVHANASFARANTANITADLAYGVANQAFAQANSAYSHANLAFAKANTADINAANGSYINTGVVKVPYGGTGVISFTTNGILYGNAAGDIKVTAAGVEGQVLQATDTGVPQFGMLDGGTF
jgi:hypothetical protein